MTDLSTLTIGDRMQRCRHENVVPHPVPKLIPRIVRQGTVQRVGLRPPPKGMRVIRCVDCDIRWEAT